MLFPDLCILSLAGVVDANDNGDDDDGGSGGVTSGMRLA